jgi:hypothetical protein
VTHPLRWLALVPLRRAELPTVERLAEWYSEHFPGAPAPQLASSTDNLLALTVGPYTAAITLVPRSVPWSQLEGPAATAWYWPEATAQLQTHPAHLLVTLIDEGGSAIEKAIALTQLTAAVAAMAPSVGVFWGPGRLVHPPAAFVEQAEDCRPENLPLFLWIDFRVEALDGGGVRAYTTGLEALGQQEVEVARFDGAPQTLVGHLYNVAHYLLDRKQVIRDGDTIGLTDNVSITVRRERSMLGGEMEVLRLEFEGDGSPDA